MVERQAHEGADEEKHGLADVHELRDDQRACDQGRTGDRDGASIQLDERLAGN